MSSKNWIARLFSQKVAPHRTARKPSYRPFVEGFEDMILMSAVSVIPPEIVQVLQAPAAPQGISFDAHDAFHNNVNGQNNNTLDRSLTPFITIDVAKVVGTDLVLVRTLSSAGQAS